MKGIAKKWLERLGYKVVNLRYTPESMASSHLDEDKILSRLVSRFVVKNKYCVDIGASDGVNMSNTFKLYQSGWRGLSVECDKEKFCILANVLARYDVDLAKCFVNPDNVVSLFASFGVPTNFGLLSIDIDGYDYFVLEKVLNKYKPKIIVAEINEKIPPPIRFAVRYKKNYFWDNSHFYGMSLSRLDDLCKGQNYKLIELHYNNAFYVYDNKAKGIDTVAAYNQGYKNKKDRKEKFYWNEDVEEVYNLKLSDQISYFNKLFADHKGQYDISASNKGHEV